MFMVKISIRLSIFYHPSLFWIYKYIHIYTNSECIWSYWTCSSDHSKSPWYKAYNSWLWEYTENNKNEERQLQHFDWVTWCKYAPIVFLIYLILATIFINKITINITSNLLYLYCQWIINYSRGTFVWTLANFDVNYLPKYWYLVCFHYIDKNIYLEY